VVELAVVEQQKRHVENVAMMDHSATRLHVKEPVLKTLLKANLMMDFVVKTDKQAILYHQAVANLIQEVIVLEK
jgi:phosphotransferase system IIB component